MLDGGDGLGGGESWDGAMARYTRACRRRFTVSFAVGHAVRALTRTPLLDGIAMLYNSPRVRSTVGCDSSLSFE